MGEFLLHGATCAKVLVASFSMGIGGAANLNAVHTFHFTAVTEPC